MKLSQLFSLMGALLIFVSFGCARKTTTSQKEQIAEGVTYNESKGLRVPGKTGDFIGLKIVDVGEEQIHTTVQFTAKIYRAAPKREAAESSNALASGHLSKSDAERLRMGQSIRVQSGDVLMTGKVIALNQESLQANGQVEVLLEIADPQHALAMGNRVSVAVPTDKAETVLGVPRAALLKTVEGNFVYTVSGEHLVRTEVKVGEINEDVAEIRDGLYAGDQVAINPVMTLWMAELQAIRGGAACADGH